MSFLKYYNLIEMLTNKRRSLLAKLREEEPGFTEVGKSIFPGHPTFSPTNTTRGRKLNASSQNNAELKTYRTSVPGSHFENWRLQSRSLNEEPQDTISEPNFSHLNYMKRRVVENLWWRKTGINRTFKSPKIARYLANIQSKYNNPLDMKNAVHALNTLTSNQKNELIKNIDNLYPVENYYHKSRGLGQRRLIRKTGNNTRRAGPENWNKLNKELAKITY
jgi:hypothetical protein